MHFDHQAIVFVEIDTAKNDICDDGDFTAISIIFWRRILGTNDEFTLLPSEV